MKETRWLIGGIALIMFGLVGLVLLSFAILPGAAADGTPVARGEWIFQTGTYPSGQPIPVLGGMGMMQASCASCHGPDGRGLQTPMFVSPNITDRNLTDPAGMAEPDGTRGPTYTDDQIRRAVTQGIDPEGETLDWPMPRWHLTDAEWSDLLAYLETLP